jgi:hypothetical protein
MQAPLGDMRKKDKELEVLQYIQRKLVVPLLDKNPPDKNCKTPYTLK